jgi:MoxR-like ATPase
MEVLVEGQVSLDRASYPLPDPFFAIATQNPMDHAGTFPLPESQIDRFACVLHLGYPDPSAERLVLRGEAGTERLESLEPAMDLAGWRLARSLVHDVRLADASMAYLERVVERIRSDKGFCSTRAAGHWLALAKAEAWLDSRDFVTPDDLQATLEDVMAHRGTLDGRRLNRDDRREQLGRLLSEVPVGWKP